jgi:hypothetical protein
MGYIMAIASCHGIYPPKGGLQITINFRFMINSLRTDGDSCHQGRESEIEKIFKIVKTY